MILCNGYNHTISNSRYLTLGLMGESRTFFKSILFNNRQPHLLGTASIPLIKVLMNFSRLLWTELDIIRSDGLFEETEPRIEVGISDETSEEYAFGKLLDAVRSADEVWARQTQERFQSDLIQNLKNTGVEVFP